MNQTPYLHLKKIFFSDNQTFKVVDLTVLQQQNVTSQPGNLTNSFTLTSSLYNYFRAQKTYHFRNSHEFHG